MPELPTTSHKCQKMRQFHPERSRDDSHETGNRLDFSLCLDENFSTKLNIEQVLLQLYNFRAQVIQFSSMFQKRGKKRQVVSFHLH